MEESHVSNDPSNGLRRRRGSEFEKPIFKLGSNFESENKVH